jgi:hypothetical protein
VGHAPWHKSPCECRLLPLQGRAYELGVQFRVNPEYARRIAATTNGAVVPVVRLPTPQPQPREETPPPLPRSPSYPPTVLPPESTTRATRALPTSRPKRKHNFELIIEIPAKRFKASRYQTVTASSSSNNSAVSSRRNPSGNSAVENPHPRPRKNQNPTTNNTIDRRIATTPFKVTLDPELRNVTVTRQYMEAQFGAHCYQPFPKIPRELVDKHGYDHFIFMHDVRPNPRGILFIHLHALLKRSAQESSPQVPSAPGEPGVVNRFKEKPWPELKLSRVFVRVCKVPARWQYMGLYKATRLPAWTPNEVRRQRPRVRLSPPMRTSLFEVTLLSDSRC